MSGFKDDVLSILRTSNLLHGEALGYIMYAREFPHSKELLKELESRKLPVAGEITKPVVLFDYTVIPDEVATLSTFLTALTSTKEGGIIIVDVTGEHRAYSKNFDTNFVNFKITRLKFDDRYYLVMHSGVDYGD